MDRLRVVAAPRRLRILQLVWDGELSAGDIAADFDVTWGAVSQHLSLLKSAGFITERREGNRRLYTANKTALGSLRTVVEEQWRDGLRRVKDLAETEQRARDRR